LRVFSLSAILACVMSIAGAEGAELPTDSGGVQFATVRPVVCTLRSLQFDLLGRWPWGSGRGSPVMAEGLDMSAWCPSWDTPAAASRAIAAAPVAVSRCIAASVGVTSAFCSQSRAAKRSLTISCMLWYSRNSSAVLRARIAIFNKPSCTFP